jgi:peptidase C25-like protein/VCBS repeat protein
MRLRTTVSLVVLAIAAQAAAASALTLDRDVRIDPSRVQLSSANGYTIVEAAGGSHEYAPGRPDLPWLAERVDLPAGMKVTGVEVLSAVTELLRDGVRIPAALSARPGAAIDERSAPDTRFFASASFQPGQLAALGSQGSLRGRNVAYLRVAPTRWNPQSGRLERITSLKLRLTLADGAAPAVKRERIVREWEDELPSGVPTRALVSLSGNSPGKPKAEPFMPLQVPSVLGSPVEYLIITNDAMAPQFQQLADWKTQSGVPAVVRTVSFIRQQYPYGADDAERIRLFIRDAYARWGTKWVLLGGDTEVIPERLAFNVSFYQVEHIAADIYYSALDGNWDNDGNSEYGEAFQDEFVPGDECDLLPEVYVGRAPVSSASDAQTFVNKTLLYEKTPASGYTDRWLLFAEVLFPQPYNGGPIDLDGAQLAEDILHFTDLNPGLTVKRLYENNTDPAYRPGALPETKAAVLTELNLGYGLALHVGHGYRNSMSCGDATMVNADASNLTNGNKLFNLYAIDCTSSAIDFPCIGEAFLKNPNGGSVSVVGSTRFDFPTAGRAYQQEYFRLFFEDSVSAVGELQARQKLPFVAFSFYDGVNRWTQMTLLELGDPELRMYNGNWRTLAVSGPASVALGDSLLSIHVETGGLPLYGARVTAYKPNDEFRTGLTDGAGNVVLPFRPDSTGAFTLTVTAYNAKPFQSTLSVTTAGGAVVSDAAVTVDDDNAGGTSGNGDGFADAGETADLRLGLRNRGSAPTNGAVHGTVSTTDAFVSVVNADGTYGSIAAGATGDPVTPFRITVPANVPDQREIPFSLVLWDGSRSWRETFQLTVRAPDLHHYEQTVTESPGNNDGRPTTGETATYTPRVRNSGSGVAKAVTAKLRCLNGLATVTDSVVTIGDIAGYATGQGDAFVFAVTGAGAQFQLEISDVLQVRSLQALDLTFPNLPTGLAAVGEADAVKLTWSGVTPLPGGTCVVNQPTCNFSGASVAVKASLAALSPGDLVTDGSNYFAIGSTVVSYNPGTFVLTLSANAFGSSPPGGVQLGIQAPDLAGYNIYRATAPAGPFTKVNVVPTDRISYFHDEALPALTRFYYRVTSVDSSGNESGMTSTVSVSTNPPHHAIFPVPTGGTTPSSVALEFPYSASNGTIAVGSDLLYVLNADGSAPVDADGQGATLGDFTVRGSYYAAGPSISTLAPGEGMSFIAPSWDSTGLYVFDKNGQMRPGFPFKTLDPIWSSAVITDLDKDGHMEMAFASNGNRFYVVRDNGLEWMDGDSNPSTKGVFKVLGSSINYASPASADIDGDGFPEIIYGSFDFKLYVWKSNGANVPGFPFTANNAILCSPAIGYLDGPGDTSPEIVFASAADSLYVLEPNGKRRAGWPKFVKSGGNTRTPSPALADMNNDGFLDVVFQSTNGGIYAFNRDGTPLAPWINARYSTLTSSASESSPVVADINGDGFPDVVCGGEEGQLCALSGADGSVLPGFPIQLGGEIRGAPAVADIDMDGKTEIVLAGWDKNIYVWDYDFPFSPGHVAPWPQYNHDARRTSFASSPLFVGVDDGGPGSDKNPVAALEFAPPAPNPAHAGRAGARMWFGVPSVMAGGAYELAIFDLSGRRVQTVDSGLAPVGRFSLNWDLRDAHGRPVDGGVYFVRFSLGGRSITHKMVVLQ